MSLRVRAGGGGVMPGLPPPRPSRSAVTWPTRPDPLPLSSRGGRLLALESAHVRPTERDRGQLAAARTLPPGGRAPVGIAHPLAHATAAASFEPVRLPDRGFRRPSWMPRTPGSPPESAGGDHPGHDPDVRGCC